MSLLINFTLKMFFKRKSYLILSVLLIVISMIGLLSMIGITTSLNSSIINYTDSCYGNYSAMLYNKSEIDLGVLNPLIQKKGRFAKIGYTSVSDHAGSYSIGCMDETAYELIAIKTISGTLPENDKQIAIESQTAEYLELRVGDTVNLTINDNYIDIYYISGIINNYSSYQRINDN